MARIGQGGVKQGQQMTPSRNIKAIFVALTDVTNTGKPLDCAKCTTIEGEETGAPDHPHRLSRAITATPARLMGVLSRARVLGCAKCIIRDSQETDTPSALGDRDSQ